MLKIYTNPNYSQTQRKYYLYSIEDWTQPVLSDYGTMGGSDYACETNSDWQDFYGWKVFDNNDDTAWGNDNIIPCYLTFYSPYPLLLTSAYFKSYSSWYTYDITLQASVDNQTWYNLGQYQATTADEEYTIDINTKKYFQYFRIYCSSASGSDISIL